MKFYLIKVPAKRFWEFEPEFCCDKDIESDFLLTRVGFGLGCLGACVDVLFGVIGSGILGLSFSFPFKT